MHKDMKLLEVFNSTLHDVSNICGKGPMATSTAVSLQRKLNLTEKVLSIHKEKMNSALSVVAPTTDMKRALKKYDDYEQAMKSLSGIKESNKSVEDMKHYMKLHSAECNKVSPSPKKKRVTKRTNAELLKYQPSNGLLFSPQEVVDILTPMHNEERKSYGDIWIENQFVPVKNYQAIRKLLNNTKYY